MVSKIESCLYLTEWQNNWGQLGQLVIMWYLLCAAASRQVCFLLQMGGHSKPRRRATRTIMIDAAAVVLQKELVLMMEAHLNAEPQNVCVCQTFFCKERTTNVLYVSQQFNTVLVKSSLSLFLHAKSLYIIYIYIITWMILDAPSLRTYICFTASSCKGNLGV